MASTAETRPARRAGTAALTSSVAEARSTVSQRHHGRTTSVTAVSVPTMRAQPVPVTAKAAAAPAIPSATPSGMPTSPNAHDCTRTAPLSWRREAPSEESRPNWRVRSETEMVKAFEMRLTAATTITVASVAANMPRLSKTRRSPVSPS